MNKITLIHFFKMTNFLQAFIVMYCLFTSENGFTQKFCIKDYVCISNLSRLCPLDGIQITAYVYDYSDPNNHHFLQRCTFEASCYNGKYFKLMEIYTPFQKRSNNTIVYFKDKLESAKLQFDQDVILPLGNWIWSNRSRKIIETKVPNLGYSAIVGVQWYFGQNYKNIRYIQVSGLWCDGVKHNTNSFHEVVYDLENPNTFALKSNFPRNKFILIMSGIHVTK